MVAKIPHFRFRYYSGKPIWFAQPIVNGKKAGLGRFGPNRRDLVRPMAAGQPL